MSIPLNGIAGTASKLYHQVLNVPYPESEEEKLISSIKAAHSDWQRAEAMFHEVTDPDLVDHAIYDVMATKSKYIYLLKTAKNKDLHL
ncbi:MAG TPA: YaaL family protein [Bacillota bacterium]|nr:YaaL family protein [Bacillota bacterium]